MGRARAEGRAKEGGGRGKPGQGEREIRSWGVLGEGRARGTWRPGGGREAGLGQGSGAGLGWGGEEVLQGGEGLCGGG